MYRLRVAIFDFLRGASVLLVGCALVAGGAGCGVKTLDPGQIGRFRPTPAVNVILDSLGVAEEPAVAWEAAEEPRPDDVRAVKTDYVIQPGDTVQVMIYELLQEAVALTSMYVVTETGKLSIPEVGEIRAAGLTETQLEAEIRRILSPSVLRNPSVTVTVVRSEQRTFSILGNGVPVPGRYSIPRYDFRLMDALATAQVSMQFNVSALYVTRRVEAAVPTVPGKPRPTPGGVPELELIQPGSSRAIPQPLPGRGPSTATQQMDIPEPSEPAQRFETEREMLEMIAPQARSDWPQSKKIIGNQPATPSRQDEAMSASMLPGGFRLLVPPQPVTPVRTPPPSVVQTPVEFGSIPSPSAQATPEPRMEWIFKDGRWVQVPAQSGAAAQPPVTPPPATVTPRGPTLPLDGGPLPMDVEWEQAIQTRTIHIPTDKLLAGDARYNIVIQPGDTIHVPVDLIGEFYIMGNVNRVGAVNLTGRPVTLKMAIAMAGGLGPLAAPRRVEVIRRLGPNQEQIVMVDLDRIASGEQPDFYIKPNDLINVGTDATSRWRAVLRNAFRATYGFGFVYDRNFADIDYGEGFPWFDGF